MDSSKPAWIFLALLVAACSVLAYFYPNGPLLACWLFIALAFGAWFAFRPGAALRQRIAHVVVLHCVLVTAALTTSQVAARRLTSATHLRFNGVLVEQADSLVVASGIEGVDVVFPTTSTMQLPWRLTLLRGSSGAWQVASNADVEQVRVTPLPHPKLSRRYSVLNGVVLERVGDSVVVQDDRQRVIDVLTLRDVDGTTVLESRANGGYHTTPTNPRLSHRFARMLQRGTPIGTLDGIRHTSAVYDRFVRVQKIADGDEVNANSARGVPLLRTLFPSTPRLLVSAAAPFSVSDGAAPPPSALGLPDSATIEVRHMGGIWRFDVLRMQREATATPALAIRFDRNPRALDTPLPSGDSCVPGAACGLLSLRRLPSPIAHIALDNAGFDPTRFALLARLRETDDGVTVVLPRDSVAIPLSNGGKGATAMVPVSTVGELTGTQPVATRTGEPVAPRHWLLMSATSHHTDGAAQVLQLSIGLALLLFLVHRLVDRMAAMQPPVRIPNERALVLGLNAVLVLLLARVIIGARVTFFPPYNAAGVNTAIGMWVAVAIVTTALLSWRMWAPRLLKFAHAISLQRPLRAASVAAAARAVFGQSVGRSGVANPGFSNTGGAIVNRMLLQQATWLLAPIVLLLMVSVYPVLMGVVAGVAVVLTWFLIAWVIAWSGPTFHSFERGPFEVIELHDTPGAILSGSLAELPERHLLFLAMLWMLVLLSPLLTPVALVLPLVLALVAQRRASKEARDGVVIETPRAPIMVVVGQILSVLMIAAIRVMSVNGAMAAFLFIILVTLVSVRSGRALAARLPRSGATRLPAWTIMMYIGAPLLLLVPLSFIDMGLLLVMCIPIGGAALLAVGVHRLRLTERLAAGFAGAGLMYLLVFKVLFPDVSALRAPDPIQRNARFESMQRFAGVTMPAALGESFERAAARAVATRDQHAAEALLISAAPGTARDLLLPSVEQVWASKAYAASGALGAGLGLAPIGNRGIAESVSYAENSYSVYILHEHGWVGGTVVLLAYLVFGAAVLLSVRRTAAIRTESMRASLALFLVATLVVIVPAVYVALSNLGVVPITGQNMPFLGLNAWSDVALCAGVVGILITGAIRTEGVNS